MNFNKKERTIRLLSLTVILMIPTIFLMFLLGLPPDLAGAAAAIIDFFIARAIVNRMERKTLR